MCGGCSDHFFILLFALFCGQRECPSLRADSFTEMGREYMWFNGDFHTITSVWNHISIPLFLIARIVLGSPGTSYYFFRAQHYMCTR